MTFQMILAMILIILGSIRDVMEEGEATVRVLKRICGKLVDIRALIPGARFHLAHILMAAFSVTDPRELERVVEVDDWCRSDLL